MAKEVLSPLVIVDLLVARKLSTITNNPLLRDSKDTKNKKTVAGVLSTISRYSTITRYTITRGDCITQEYVNREANPIEVLYSYPVEESAAIIAFEANIDGHEIEAEVKKKEEAKAEYDLAMDQGNTAILLEETAADIFSMKLGQLKPGAGAKVKLTYIMELPVEDKSIRLTIPTTIAPR